MFGIDIAGILASAMTAFIPVGIDIVKGVANKFIGGPQMQPANFSEFLQLQDAEVKRLEAIAKLDQPIGNVSKWVSNIRASIRYIVAIMVLSVWAITAIVSLWVPVENTVLAWIGNMATAVMFFLFGEKVTMNLSPQRR